MKNAVLILVSGVFAGNGKYSQVIKSRNVYAEECLTPLLPTADDNDRMHIAISLCNRSTEAVNKTICGPERKETIPMTVKQICRFALYAKSYWCPKKFTMKSDTELKELLLIQCNNGFRSCQANETCAAEKTVHHYYKLHKQMDLPNYRRHATGGLLVLHDVEPIMRHELEMFKKYYNNSKDSDIREGYEDLWRTVGLTLTHMPKVPPEGLVPDELSNESSIVEIKEYMNAIELKKESAILPIAKQDAAKHLEKWKNADTQAKMEISFPSKKRLTIHTTKEGETPAHYKPAESSSQSNHAHHKKPHHEQEHAHQEQEHASQEQVHHKGHKAAHLRPIKKAS